jgi:hypothetical protein
MTGFVDDQLRAMVRVPVSASCDGPRKEILVWIDTVTVWRSTTRHEPSRLHEI